MATGPVLAADGTGARPGPGIDRWDLGVLAAVPFLAAMISCAASALDVLPGSIPDVTYYAKIGGEVASGALPYRDFPFEYPPLAILPMTVPDLLWLGTLPGLLQYQWIWAFMTGIAALIVGLLVAWIAARPGSVVTPWRALLAWALLALIETPLITWRYDIFAVALTVGGLALVLAGRPGWSGAALAAGTLLKLFPILLVPILGAWLLARRESAAAGRLVASFGAIMAVAVVAVVAIVGVDPALQFVRYQQERLVQIESLASSLALLAHVAGGFPVFLGYGFQSLQIRAPGFETALAMSTPILVAAVGGIVLLAVLRLWSERDEPGGPRFISLVRGIAAAIIVLLLANKVFSAQYLLWFLPFACLLPRRQAALTVLIAICSVLIFPLGYQELAELQVQAVLVLAARNALLVVLLAWLVVELRPLPGWDRYGSWTPPWSRSERTSYTRNRGVSTATGNRAE